jgi:hypothetical protein
MTTPDEFLERVLGTVDDVAFRLSHTPQDAQEEWLEGFADRLRAQWREALRPFLTGEDVNGMVEDVIKRVRKGRDGIESVGLGSA